MTLQARYTILRKIADGGTSEIFLATQHGAHGFEKPVVLKRIFPAFYADPQFRNMLIDEAHIAMSLNHGNIVQVLDLGEADGQYVLALDLVDGWTLDSVLRRARALNTSIPPALALYMTAEICRALAYAHAKTGSDGKPLGIVHRDISPHNVLLSEQGEVKLTDFGIAKAANRRESSVGNIIKGKIAYMSPEQASGAELDLRSDLFSVGTMLYVMICGRYPFDAPTDLEVLLLVKNGECVPPEKTRPGLNPEIYRVLRRAMAKMPDDRYQRAEEMLVDFEQVMRIAFRAVGQTELKRWLQDLSMRDGVPSLTRAPAVASTGSAIAGRLEGETLELRGIGTPALPAPPATLPAPTASTRPNRSTTPSPPSGRGGSTTGMRPPPPPAAMAVGVPAMRAATARPGTTPGTTPGATPEATPAPTIAESPTLVVAADKPATEVPAAKIATLDSPRAPRKSSSWVAEAVLASAKRAGIAPPPPVSPMVPVPPFVLPVPHVTGDVKPPPTPPEPTPPSRLRRLVIVVGIGAALLLVIGLSMKTCGRHANDSQSANPETPNDIVLPRVTSNVAAPPVANPAIPSPSVSAPEAGVQPVDASLGVATSPIDSGVAGLPDPIERNTSVGVPDATPAPANDGGSRQDPDTDGEADAQTTAAIPKVAVLLRSSPPGAEVGTPHHPFGSTPVSVKLKVGRTYSLVFTRDGYRPVTKQIRVSSEAGQQLTATLRPAPAPQAAPPSGQAAPRPPAKPAERTWFQRMFAR